MYLFLSYTSDQVHGRITAPGRLNRTDTVEQARPYTVVLPVVHREKRSRTGHIVKTVVNPKLESIRIILDRCAHDAADHCRTPTTDRSPSNIHCGDAHLNVIPPHIQDSAYLRTRSGPVLDRFWTTSGRLGPGWPDWTAGWDQGHLTLLLRCFGLFCRFWPFCSTGEVVVNVPTPGSTPPVSTR